MIIGGLCFIVGAIGIVFYLINEFCFKKDLSNKMDEYSIVFLLGGVSTGYLCTLIERFF